MTDDAPETIPVDQHIFAIIETQATRRRSEEDARIFVQLSFPANEQTMPLLAILAMHLKHKISVHFGEVQLPLPDEQADAFDAEMSRQLGIDQTKLKAARLAAQNFVDGVPPPGNRHQPAMVGLNGEAILPHAFVLNPSDVTSPICSDCGFHRTNVIHGTESIVDAVGAAIVDAVNAGALDSPGVTVTARAGRGSANRRPVDPDEAAQAEANLSSRARD